MPEHFSVRTVNEQLSNETIGGLTHEQVRRARLRCAEAAGDREELVELLDALGIGPVIEVRMREEVLT